MSAVVVTTEELKTACVEHPRFKARVLPKELEQSVSPDTIRQYYDAINDAIEMEKTDPLRYGFEPAIWTKADETLAAFRAKHPAGAIVFMVMGGNRASKTEWRSKRLVQNMLTKPGYIAWACHTTQTSSRDAQQRKIYKYIPPEYKPESGRFRMGKVAKVNYTPWGGFTTDGFALPDVNGGVSECAFKFYGIDPRALEGSEIDEGWMDEEAPVEWMDALIGRAVTRNGVVFLTYTAKHGFTPIIRTVLDGARTVEETDAELLALFDGSGQRIGTERVPRVQENETIVITSGGEDDEPAHRLKVKGSVIYFHTADNPYGNYDAMKATLEGASRGRILWQAYGVPQKTIASQFNYKDTVHTMAAATYKALVEKLGNNGPRYQLIDPCPGRNWFMLWIWFWAPKRAIIYREWPSTGHAGAFIEGIGDPGPWAVPGKSPDGDRGEAQRPMRFGYERYVEEIAKAEGWWDENVKTSIATMGNAKERIMMRLVDGRYAVSPTQMREGATTWIQEMSGIGLDYMAMTGEKKILSGESDGSVELINRALSYDEKVPIGQFSAELGRVNEPELYVLETCTNTKFALETWTGRDGAHGACKDPIDCVRGAYLSELDYVDEVMMTPSTPWRNQFAGK